MGRYTESFRQAGHDREAFWLGAARAIDWDVEPATALDPTAGPSGRWFPDGRLNTCYNALDRHVAQGAGDRTALIWDSAMTGGRRTYSYAALLDEVARFAGVLAAAGIGVGDRVVIYLPMIPEAAVSMLACARIGAIHSVVFGGFAAPELAARIADADPAAIVTATGGLEPGRRIDYQPIVRAALDLAGRPDLTVIVKHRPEVADAPPSDRWLDWDTAMSTAAPAAPTVVASTDPLYILYTSGTTGKPKGVVRDNGGHAVALAWSMANIYLIGTGDVWWTASDVGWVVGHSYIVYGPLLAGATTVMYEGKPVGTPDAGAFWRVIAQYGVNALFTAPTALRAIRKADPSAVERDRYDLACLRTVFAAGERLDPDTLAWVGDVLDVPVIDHWWQTETGWAIAANLRGLEPMPVKPGSATVPVPGWAVAIVDADGVRLPAGQEGNIVVELPLPPGALVGLWRDDERFGASYFAAFGGHYLTGDTGYLDSDGYLFVLGRSDDVLNVAGHRLSSGRIEAVVAAHPAVAEVAVVGVHDDLKGQRPIGYVVLKSDADICAEQLRDELIARVREDVGAVASFRDVTVVSTLPKTRSGKILRKTIRQMVDGDDYSVPPTIEDENVLFTLAEQLGVRPPSAVADASGTVAAQSSTVESR